MNSEIEEYMDDFAQEYSEYFIDDNLSEIKEALRGITDVNEDDIAELFISNPALSTTLKDFISETISQYAETVAFKGFVRAYTLLGELEIWNGWEDYIYNGYTIDSIEALVYAILYEEFNHEFGYITQAFIASIMNRIDTILN